MLARTLFLVPSQCGGEMKRCGDQARNLNDRFTAAIKEVESINESLRRNATSKRTVCTRHPISSRANWLKELLSSVIFKSGRWS